jgi:hypothetical protein
MYMRLAGLTLVKVSILVFWIVTPCGLVVVKRPRFLTNVLSVSLTLKMETLCSSESLVSTYKSTWFYNIV